MRRSQNSRLFGGFRAPPPLLIFFLVLASVLSATFACRRSTPVIALIPRTTGVSLWESERSGAESVASRLHFRLYWNAPTREDDIEGQIALVERVRRGGYAGLVLAPDQALALMTPVQQVLSAGIPTVIVSSPLPLAPGNHLFYVVNDNEEAGRIAAKRIAAILHGKGSVALLSIDPDISGIMTRLAVFESYLAHYYPDIHTVGKRMGAYNGAEAQQITAELLQAHPELDALFSFTAVSTRGAYFALKSMGRIRDVKLVGCEQEGDLLDLVSQGEIDSLLLEDTYQMGRKALELIAAHQQGKRVPASISLRPLLVTRENINSPEIVRALDRGWSGVPDE